MAKEQAEQEQGVSITEELRHAVVACLRIAYPRHGQEKPPFAIDLNWFKETESPCQESGQAEACLSESKVAEVNRAKNQIEEVASADATRLAAHLNQLVEHLQAVGCTDQADVEQYFRAANRTLASLYFAAKQPHPSPDELTRLALRFVLDARRPVQGDLRRYDLRRLERGWEIAEYPSVVARRLPFRLPSRIIGDVHKVSVLDFVFARLPQIFDLMKMIEDVLGGIPSEDDCLRQDGCVEFEPLGPKIRVDLQKNIIWLDGEPTPVTSAQAYFVDAVVAAHRAHRDWMSVKKLASEEHRLSVGSRPDRVYKALPESIKRLIESKGGSGYRLKWRK
jgi:hypothetical protein